MRLVATFLAALAVLAVTACGSGEDDDPVVLEPNPEQGLTMTLDHTEPLRANAPVTWTLTLRNGGREPVALTFASGQRGDVVLSRGSAERYRWSTGKVFTQVFGEMSLAPGQVESFELKDDVLDVEPGQYDLVASVQSQPSPAEARRTVTVTG